jgi:hypothetical protein
MSAGTGVRHSEFNASKTDLVHFLQIWIVPDRQGHTPGYEQKNFSSAEKQGKLRVVASSDGRDGSVTIHQDAMLFAGLFGAGEATSYELRAARHAWLHVAKGTVEVNGETLNAGDAAAIDDPGTIEIRGTSSGEVLLFDLS